MKIAFTGTRHVQSGLDGDWSSDEIKIRDVVDSLETSELITGACVGVDALVAFWGMNSDRHDVHTVVPANRSQVDPDWQAYCDTFEEMPAGTDYRDRNTRMVELCDRLIAFPDHAESDPRSRRSGTWMTVRIARKAGKPVEIHQLH